MSSIRTRSQHHAEMVLQRVQDFVKNTQDSNQQKKYKGLCKRAGSLVRNAGLMQTVAFFEARGRRETEPQYHVLLKHLQEELAEVLEQNWSATGQAEHPLVGFVKESDLSTYMRLTRETLQLLNWHKCYVDVLIEGEGITEENEDEDPHD